MIHPIDHNPNAGRIRRFIRDLVLAVFFLAAAWSAYILAWAVL